MKPDVSRSGRNRRRYRRDAKGTCAMCRKHPARPGQRHCAGCHALFQRFWRVKEKVKRRSLDDDVKMVALGMEILARRLGVAGTLR